MSIVYLGFVHEVIDVRKVCDTVADTDCNQAIFLDPISTKQVLKT